MSLSASCVKHIGQKLFLQPITMWVNIVPEPDGIVSPHSYTSYVNIDLLHIHLNFLYCFPTQIETFCTRSEWRGGIGRVEQPGHQFDGQWLVFYTRDSGQYDFTRFMGRYVVLVGPEQPRFVKSDSALWGGPDCRFGTSSYFRGEARIAVSQETLQKWEERRIYMQNDLSIPGSLAEWLP